MIKHFFKWLLPIAVLSICNNQSQASQKSIKHLSFNITISKALDQDDREKKEALEAKQKRANEIEEQKKQLKLAHKEREKETKRYQATIKKSENLEKKIAKQRKTIEKLESNLKEKISSNSIDKIREHKENIKISKAKIKLNELMLDLDKAHDDILKLNK